MVALSTNSDRTYLRIRIRSRDEEESENDGGKANQRDIKFKVRHIAKIGSERESAVDRNRPDHEKPKNKSFVIKMKYPVGEFTKFKFLAQSLAERDSVLLAIKSLLDQGRQQQYASHPSKSQQQIEFEKGSDPVNVKSFKALQLSERNAHVDEDADSFTIPAPKNLIDPPEEEEIFYDTRDEPTSHARSIGDPERDDNLHVFGRSAELNTFQRENGASRPYDNPYYKSATPEDPATMAKLNRNRPDKWMEKKTTSSHRRTATSDMTGRKYQPASKMIQSKQKARAQKILESHRTRSDTDFSDSSSKEMADAKLSGNSHAFNPSQAFSALENVDISNLAADFTNPVVGPWCTDDICTASLRDFADSMTGIFDLKDNRQIKGVNAANKVNRVKAEEYISGFLGDKTNMSELLSVRDLWNVAANKHATGKELKKVHNRARKSSGQANRLINLRKQMTFAGGDQRNASTLQTISSFDDVQRKKREMGDDDLLYYDSDPEDARERTFRKGPREVMARRKEEDIRSRVKRREALDILDTTRFGLGRRWRRVGQDVLSDIIEATKNEKITLLWHPTQNSEPNGNMPPVCVNVWVESGIYLTDGTFLLPKLSWLPAHEKNLQNRVLNISDKNPGSLDLLDVCRVKECETIDRDLYPLANTERCFVIQTQSARYVFEAQSKQERGRVVNGLKLVIARLASLLMLKDLRAVDEFFGGNQVPGEAPIWARGYDRSDSEDGFPSA